MTIKKKNSPISRNASVTKKLTALDALANLDGSTSSKLDFVQSLKVTDGFRLKKLLVKKSAETSINETVAGDFTATGASNSPAPIVLAQLGPVSGSDTSGSSTTPTDLSSVDNATADSATLTTDKSAGLSTAQMVGLGLLGVAAAGGITAIALSSSGSSSNSANTSSPQPTNTTPQTINTPTPQITDTTAPQIQSLSAHSSTRTIELTYNEALDPLHLPPASAFTISTNGISNTVSGIAVNGNVMTLTLANAFSAGALTVGYSDPTTRNDVAAIQDTVGNDASGFLQGIVADGYISGAQIFLDTNNNGIADAGESTGIVTGSDGSFFLPNTLPYATIIAVGGTNIDTGIAQTTPLLAPAGSVVINPLTTLVQALVSQTGTSISTASSQVATALGLSSVDLLTYDPLASSDATSLAAQKVAAQLATLVNLAAGSDSATAGYVWDNLASAIQSYSGSAINLSSSSVINDALANTGSTTSSASIVSANTAIDAATSINTISQAQSQAQNDVDLLSMSGGGFKALSADAGLIAGLLDYYDGTGTADLALLESLFNDSLTLSANSGSTWFLDLLAYQETFGASLVDYQNLFDAGANGFMGEMGTAYQSYFTAHPNTTLTATVDAINAVFGAIDTLLLGHFYNNLQDLISQLGVADPNQYLGAASVLLYNDISWPDFLSQTVFSPDGSTTLLQNINFANGTSRTSVLDTQSLVYMIGLATDQAVINASGNNHNVTWVSANTGDNQFIPGTVTSIVGNQIAGDALPSVSDNSIILTYGTTADSTTSTTTYNNVNFNGLSAFTASSASSSATGFIGSLGVIEATIRQSISNLLNVVFPQGISDLIASGLESNLQSLENELTNYFKDLATLASIDELGSVSGANDSLLGASTSVSAADTAGYVRLVDGGFIDNSSFTAGLGNLLANNTFIANDNFTDFAATQIAYASTTTPDWLTAFSTSTGKAYSNIGDTTAQLFAGSSPDFSSSIAENHPTPQIFDAAYTQGLAAPVWEYDVAHGSNTSTTADDYTFKLQYFQLEVKTVANDQNITPGLLGSLDLWLVTNPTQAIPLFTPSYTWSDYEIMYDDIRTALQHIDNTGNTNHTLAGYAGAELFALSIGSNAVLPL